MKRFIQWAMQHRPEWEIICGLSGPLSQEDFDRIARMLLCAHFPEAYCILWYRYASKNGVPVFIDLQK